MKLTREEPFRRHKIQYMSLYMYTNSCLFYDSFIHLFETWSHWRRWTKTANQNGWWPFHPWPECQRSTQKCSTPYLWATGKGSLAFWVSIINDHIYLEKFTFIKCCFPLAFRMSEKLKTVESLDFMVAKFLWNSGVPIIHINIFHILHELMN